ncbi:MAG: (2Fe-2S)-binding protein [Actinobacteria bacterium]|nr:(2Fe-2S)-binding protein [Actinomycetota bacterium]
MPSHTATVAMEVNDTTVAAAVETRTSLAEFLRVQAGLTGTKLGCEHGVCGACTVLVDDEPTRGCLVFAAQVDGKKVRTVEGLADGRALNRLQQAFHENFGLQCGFCTGGILMSMTSLMEKEPNPSREQIVEWLSGHLCRCTGYETIINAVLAAVAGGEDLR